MKKDQHNFHGLMHAADLVEGILREELAPLGILPRQARIVDAINRMEKSSQSELASQFKITAASMSTMTDRLLVAGYIKRTVDPTSRRQNVLELTKTGRKLLNGIDEVWSNMDRKLRKILGQDTEVFFNKARQLRDALGGKVPGA